MPKIDPLDSSAFTKIVAVLVFLALHVKQKSRQIVRTGVFPDHPVVSALRLECDPVCSACSMT